MGTGKSSANVSYPKILEVGEGDVEGSGLGVHELPDHGLLLFCEGSRRPAPPLLALPAPDQSSTPLHRRIRHDHWENSTELRPCLCGDTLGQGA